MNAQCLTLSTLPPYPDDVNQTTSLGNFEGIMLGDHFVAFVFLGGFGDHCVGGGLGDHCVGGGFGCHWVGGGLGCHLVGGGCGFHVFVALVGGVHHTFFSFFSHSFFSSFFHSF